MFKALIISLFLLIGGFQFSSFASASDDNTTTAAQAAYIYEYHEIDGVVWVFVYTSDGVLINTYPEE